MKNLKPFPCNVCQSYSSLLDLINAKVELFFSWTLTPHVYTFHLPDDRIVTARDEMFQVFPFCIYVQVANA